MFYQLNMDQVCPLERDTAEIRNGQDANRDRNIGIDICNAYQHRRKEANDNPLNDIDKCNVLAQSKYEIRNAIPAYPQEKICHDKFPGDNSIPFHSVHGMERIVDIIIKRKRIREDKELHFKHLLNYDSHDQSDSSGQDSKNEGLIDTVFLEE